MQLFAKLVVVTASLVWTASCDSAALTDGNQAGGAILQKVVVMLQDMVGAANKEKKEEEVAFSEFDQWCTNEKGSLNSEIATQSQNIETYSAEVAKLDQEAKALGESIAQMQADVEKSNDDLNKANAQRDKDHEAFLAEEQDYSESVDALERAINVLKKQAYDRPALVQIAENQQLPSKAKDMISAFIGIMADSDNATGLDYTEPEADAYEFQSGSIVELLEKLLEDFKDQLSQCQKEEMNSRHAHDMVSEDLTNFIQKSNEDINSRAATKQSKHESSAMNQKELTRSQELHATGEKTLSDVTAECFEKTESYNEKQKLRTEELEALQKAIEILSSEEVQGLSGKTFLQARTAAALAQMADAGLRGSKGVGIRRRLSEFLSSEGQRLHSSQIAALAQQAASDPFEKVKVLIRDLMERLLQEAHADAEHEGFCDKEMGVNKQTRESLTAEIEGLTADIDNGKASIASMTEETAQLTKEVADHNAAMVEATKLRTQEKADNKATVEEATEGETAVKQAMAVLKEFYNKALKATAFLQRNESFLQYPHMGSEEWQALANTSYEGVVDKGHKEGMQTFGDTYQGQQEEAGGVLAMLEVIMSDFATLRTETEASEKVSQKQYEEFEQATKTDVAAKTKKIDLLAADKAKAEEKLRADESDHRLAGDKLDSANRYYDDLKEQCLDKGVTWEERQAARASEIQSLKEALKILSYEDIGSADDQER